MSTDVLAPFDAVLLLSFGGPEAPAEVMPFLEYVTRGRGIPRERLEGVADHYQLFGGVSPINGQNRALLAVLEPALRAAGSDLPVYWGNRNSAPWIRDVALQMQADGIRRPVVFVTSAYSSYSGCRQYREDLAMAFDGIDIDVSKVAQFFDAEGFITANTDAVVAAMADAPLGTRFLFVTHSVPVSAHTPRYVEQHEAVAREIERRAGTHGVDISGWQLVYCSRSGAPGQPWLEPDVNDVLRSLAADGVTDVCLSAIGFISDHMEVLFDLDTEALATAQSLGITLRRAATPGTSAAFVNGIVSLLLERAAIARGVEMPGVRIALGCAPALPVCAIDCCANPRVQRPSLCGESA